MKQSYHFYRRRVRLIRCASYNAYLAEAKAEWAAGGDGLEAMFSHFRDEREDRLLAQARRQFEASRQKGA
jgi:hypothetical protein